MGSGLPSSRDRLDRLAALPSSLPHDQKICDATDWRDPRLDVVIREFLHLEPNPNCRQWEYAMTFSLLAAHGCFGDGRRGIAYGAGREPLTYAIPALVDRLAVTDIYSAGTDWDTARTGSPRNFILEVDAPQFDRSRLDVLSMDMRRVAFADESFDFAYSVSVFEHIGDEPDFVEHLREARRVLRDGGVYVMTTELRLHPDSFPVTGNYAFGFAQLMRVVQASGFSCQGVMDASLAPIALNKPRVSPAILRHDPARQADLEPFIVRQAGGVMSVPCVLVLTRRTGTPAAACELRGFGDSRAFAETWRWRESVAYFREWVSLNPYGAFLSRQIPCSSLYPREEEHPPSGPRACFSTSYLHYGDAEMETRITLMAESLSPSAEISIRVNEWSLQDISRIVTVAERVVVLGESHRRVCQATLRFTAKAEHAYAVVGLFLNGRETLSLVETIVRNRPEA